MNGECPAGMCMTAHCNGWGDDTIPQTCLDRPKVPSYALWTSQARISRAHGVRSNSHNLVLSEKPPGT